MQPRRGRAYLAALAPGGGSEVPLAAALLPALLVQAEAELERLVLQVRPLASPGSLPDHANVQTTQEGELHGHWWSGRALPGCPIARRAQQNGSYTGDAAAAAAAQQWGACDVLPAATGLELCSGGAPGLGPGPGPAAGAVLDDSTARALLAALARPGTAANATYAIGQCLPVVRVGFMRSLCGQVTSP